MHADERVDAAVYRRRRAAFGALVLGFVAMVAAVAGSLAGPDGPNPQAAVDLRAPTAEEILAREERAERREELARRREEREEERRRRERARASDDVAEAPAETGDAAPASDAPSAGPPSAPQQPEAQEPTPAEPAPPAPQPSPAPAYDPRSYSVP